MFAGAKDSPSPAGLTVAERSKAQAEAVADRC